MRSPTFATIARWSLVLAASAAPGLASSIYSPSTPVSAAISMLQLEQQLFGFDPADGYSIAQQSQLWTTDTNAALYNNMLLLITTLGGDPNLIAQLFQPGAVFSGQGNPLATPSLQSALVLDSVSTQSSATPEPATMDLFGGALLFFCCFALLRDRQLKAAPAPEPAGPWADTTH